MLLEIHKCDRCGRKIEVPDDTLYVIFDPMVNDPNPETDEIDLCCLCKESQKAWFNAKDIDSGLLGVLDNEKRLRKEKEQEEREDQDI